MSKSYRHSPYHKLTTTGYNHSEQQWKRTNNRALRRKHRQQMQSAQVEHVNDLIHLYEISDIWDSPSDGKIDESALYYNYGRCSCGYDQTATIIPRRDPTRCTCGYEEDGEQYMMRRWWQIFGK